MDPLSSNFAKSLNINAPAFVPTGFSSHNLAEEQAPSTLTTDAENMPEPTTSQSDRPVEESTSNDEVVDDWEMKADKAEEVGAEEKEEDEEEDEEDESSLDANDDLEKVAATSKKKIKKISECMDTGPKKEHNNIVFIGHVDAGKSTIGGQLLYLTGMVDKRTLEKYEREAKEKNRESWYLSWALDTNQEERDKGKTVECGRAFFETEKKHFTLLDAPGHKGFVPNMISGASQADVAVLVISARKGEFETGFERGGQTREHAMLAKTSGVKHLIVLINKMDDPTVQWDLGRYNECKDKLVPFLKKVGFNIKTDVYFMPCSGLNGAFLKEIPPESECPWFRGPSFLSYIDDLPPMTRHIDGPFRLPIVDKYKDMGTVILGKIEAGSVKRGQTLIVMPNRKEVEVLNLWLDEDEVNFCGTGENVKIKLKGIEEEEVTPGFVLCDLSFPCNVGKTFDAQVVILEHKSIICPGYSAVLHMHTAVEEVTIKAIICLIDRKTQEKSKTRPRFVKQDQTAIMRFEVVGGMICMETFKDFSQMGRFTLRDEGKTIAIGKVLRVVE